MVLFFCATLLISIAGLVSLLYIKQWELRTGNMLLAGMRPRVGNISRTFLTWIERALPSLIAGKAEEAFAAAHVWVHKMAARGLLAAERGLEDVLHSVRGVTDHKKSSAEASPFLREVAEHKRKLMFEKKLEAEVDRQE